MGSYGRTIGDRQGVLHTASSFQQACLPPTFDVAQRFQWNPIRLTASGDAAVSVGIDDITYSRGAFQPLRNQRTSASAVRSGAYETCNTYGFGATEVCNAFTERQRRINNIIPPDRPTPLRFFGSNQRFSNLERQERDRTSALALRNPHAASPNGGRCVRISSDESPAPNGRNNRFKVTKHKGLPCPEPGCHNTNGFRGRFELERHKKTKHGLEPAVGDRRLFQCALSDCLHSEEIYQRADKFRTHVQQEHPTVDVEGHILASTVIGTTENESINVALGSINDQEMKESPPYPTSPDSISGQPHLSWNDTTSIHDYTGYYNIADTSTQHEWKTAIPTGLETKENPPASLVLHVHATSDGSNSDPELSKSQPDPLHSMHSTLTAVRHLLPKLETCLEPVDGQGGNYGQQKTTQHLSTATDSWPQGHQRNLSALGKRQNRDDELSPQPPRDKRTSSTKSRSDRPGFVCAFHNNPRPCRWKPHGQRHEFVSTLKRFHEMHGLYYCGICFAEFFIKDDLKAHKRADCTQYRCFIANCPGQNQLVASSCPHHNRKNTQEEIHQYLCILALRFRERQDVRSRTPAVPSVASVRYPATPTSGIGNMSITSQTSPTFSSTAFNPNTPGMESFEMINPSAPTSSFQDRQMMPPRQNVDSEERNKSLESLIYMMWRRVEADDLNVDENLSSYYHENIPHGPQASMQSNEESRSQYRARVLENLARQLWNELHKTSCTRRDELRVRVYDRMPHLRSHPDCNATVPVSSQRVANGHYVAVQNGPQMSYGEISGPSNLAGRNGPMNGSYAGARVEHGSPSAQPVEQRNAFGGILTSAPLPSGDHLISDLSGPSAFSDPTSTNVHPFATTGHQSVDTRFDMNDFIDFTNTLPHSSNEPWFARDSIQPNSNFPPTVQPDQDMIPETTEDDLYGTEESVVYS